MRITIIFFQRIKKIKIKITYNTNDILIFDIISMSKDHESIESRETTKITIKNLLYKKDHESKLQE